MFWMGHMGWRLLGGGLGFLFLAGLIKLAVLGGLIALLVMALRSHRTYSVRPAASSSALDVLNMRYARGELTKAQYDEIKCDLGH